MGRDKMELPSLALCGVFAVLALAVTLLTGGVYRRCVERSDENYVCRVALSYVTNQLRRGDRAGAVSVTDFEGLTALKIAQEEGYELLLYCSGGQFRELYAAVDGGFSPADGDALFPMEELAVRREGALLDLTLTGTGGETYSASVALRCGEAAA